MTGEQNDPHGTQRLEPYGETQVRLSEYRWRGHVPRTHRWQARRTGPAATVTAVLVWLCLVVLALRMATEGGWFGVAGLGLAVVLGLAAVGTRREFVRHNEAMAEAIRRFDAERADAERPEPGPER